MFLSNNFADQAVKEWKSPLIDLKGTKFLSIFKEKLKTFLNGFN